MLLDESLEFDESIFRIGLIRFDKEVSLKHFVTKAFYAVTKTFGLFHVTSHESIAFALVLAKLCKTQLALISVGLFEL